MALLKHPKVEALENSLQAQLKRDLSEKELFSFAPFDAEEAELTGASNYSYWLPSALSEKTGWPCFCSF